MVDFEHINFELLTMSDAQGREHVFQFRDNIVVVSKAVV